MRSDVRPFTTQERAALSRSPVVSREVRSVANSIARDARRLAPRNTGRLRRGISVERMYDSETGMVHFIVGWAPFAFYGLIVETGGEGEPPRPHLIPAAIKHGAR